MKLNKAIVATLTLIPFGYLSAETVEDEFKAINAARHQREALIDYLKSEKLLKETKTGTLSATGQLRAKAIKALSAENKDRLRQFAIIGQLEGKSPAEIAKNFAVSMGVDVTAKEVELILRLHGSNTVGASLAPELVRAFLRKQGYSNILTQKKGVETTISFDQPGKKTLGVVEIKAHGSSTAFKETSSSKEVGLLGGYADIGMASRQIKNKEVSALKQGGFGNMRSAVSEFPIALDGVAVVVNRNNPVKSLTSAQIAQLFSGAITNWKQLGGTDTPVSVFARDDQSGTFDTFKSKVLKPSKSKLVSSAKRFEDSGLLVRNVASEPGGIGFCGLAYVDSTVSGLAVSSSKGLIAFQPTRLTVKTQNYPLSRLLYFYLPLNANTTARDFVKFTMSNEGQAAVDKVGLVGQGLSTSKDKRLADIYKKNLLNTQTAPAEYKNIIKNADRRDSQANIRFEQGSNNPDINSVNNLERLVHLLAESENEQTKVILIGFADSIGSPSSNQRLSLGRAQAVAEMLKAKGVLDIQVAGFGEAMPVADNRTKAGQAKNRRVEIWLER